MPLNTHPNSSHLGLREGSEPVVEQSSKSNMTAVGKRRLWLDALPSEIHHRIVSHLLPVADDPESFYHFLCLAESSPSFHAVILIALSFKFRITRRFEHLDRWATLLIPSLRELDIRVIPRRNHSHTIQLINGPSLEQLTMVAHPLLIPAWRHAPFLRSLSLQVYKHMYVKQIFQCLKTLKRLTHLTLHLLGHRNAKRRRCDLLPPGEDHVDMALCCQNVSSLDLECRCYNSERCMAWRFAYAIPSLRHLTMRQRIVDWFLDYDFDEGMYDNSILLMPRFPRLVENLAVVFTPYCVYYDAYFGDCPTPQTSETFALTLQTGAKLIFPCSPSTFKSFHISWPPKAWHGEYIFPREHHEFEHDTLFRSIQTMPALSILSLNQVRIQIHELASILAYIGPRLLRLGVSIEGQIEEPDERFKILVETLSNHNPSIEELSLDFLSITKHRNHTGINKSQLVHGEDDLRKAYQDLLWKRPHLQIMDRDAGRVRSYAEVENIVFGDLCDVTSD